MTSRWIHVYDFVADTVYLVLTHVLIEVKLNEDKSSHVKRDANDFQKSFQVPAKVC